MMRQRDYFNNVVNHMHALSLSIADAERQVFAIWPTIDKARDVRITAFSKLGNVTVSTTFAMHFFAKEMLDDQWWQAHVTNFQEFQPELIDYIFEQYQQVIKLGFVYLSWAAIESSIRNFSSVVDPKFANDDSFKNVYYHLIKKLKLKRQYRNLLDLMRLCRNTTHTNGYHNARNETIAYKGKKYSFVKGETPKYFEWSEYMHLVYDAKDLLLQIVKSPEFRDQDKIEDPFAIVSDFTPRTI